MNRFLPVTFISGLLVSLMIYLVPLATAQEVPPAPKEPAKKESFLLPVPMTVRCGPTKDFIAWVKKLGAQVLIIAEGDTEKGIRMMFVLPSSETILVVHDRGDGTSCLIDAFVKAQVNKRFLNLGTERGA